MSALYKTVTDTIVQALERGVVPWRKPWSTTASIPINALSRRAYRGVNVLLLSLTPYSDSRWLTFRQAQERGGRVRKGERSTLVVFWKRPEETDESTSPEERRQQQPLLIYHRVFNVEQCEGLELPEEHRPEEHPHVPIERAEVMVREMPDPPRITNGPSAWYRPADDVVQIPQLGAFRSAESYYATLFHELAHSTGHERRLNRAAVNGEVQFGSGVYSREELVAEIASAFCCATASLDNTLIEDAASYMQGWLSVLRSDSKAVVIAAAQAQRAADFIKGVAYS